MPRTKSRFAEDPPSDDSSSEEEEGGHTSTVVRGGGYGGGKQLRMMGRPGGGGKQLRMPQPESDKSESESDSESEDEPPPQTTTIMYNRGGGGKQFRPAGGKALRMPEPESDESEGSGSGSGDDEEGSDEDDGSDEDEDGSEEEQPPPPPPQTQPVYRATGGKSLMRMQRGGGKQLRHPAADEDDSESDDSDEDEDEPQQSSTVVVQHGAFRGGKQLRAPTSQTKQEDEDEEESDESEEEYSGKEGETEDNVGAGGDDMDIDEDSGEDEAATEEAKPTKAETESAPPPPTPPPPPPPKEPSESEAEDMEESASEKGSEDEDDSSSSSSESEEERELDMETFDTQELVQGEEDQKHLDSLPEFEREAILGERFEKLKNAADMKRALRESKRKEREKRKLAKAEKSATTKRKAPSKEKTPSKKEKKDSDEPPDTSGDAALAASLAGRESTRNRDVGGSKGKKAAALAAIREERASKAPEKKDDESDLDYGTESNDDSDDDEYEDNTFMNKPWLQKKKTRLSKEVSDEESSGEEEDGTAGLQSSMEKGNFVEAELEDYIKVTIPRRRLARWCNEPFFEEAVKNFYLRLGIGRDSMTQKPCYRLCKIIGVKNGSEYKFPAAKNQKPISTNKWLTLRFGKDVNSFRMIMVSDSRPTAEDLRRYVNQLKNTRSNDFLSKKKATKLRKAQDDLVSNYTYTKEDIEKSIEAKKKRSKNVMNIGMEKTRISIAVQAAREAVKEAKRQLEEAKVALLEAGDNANNFEEDQLEKNVELATEVFTDAEADLEAKLLEQKNIFDAEEKRKQRIQQSAKVRNWVQVNERAAMANQSADFQSYKEQLERDKSEAASNGATKFDPYARRKVKPKILWEVGQKSEEEKDKVEGKPNEGDANDAIKENEIAGNALKSNGRDDVDEVKQRDKENHRDDFIGSKKAALVGQSHQFAIDEEVLAQSSGGIGAANPFGGQIAGKRARTRVRKGLSLSEYQERKAAGTL